MSGDEGSSGARSALPSLRARVVATAAIVLAGSCGGLIGYALVDVSCSGSCGWQLGLGTLLGATAGATGVAVVASLTLRAMQEWRSNPQARPTPEGTRASRPRRRR